MAKLLHIDASPKASANSRSLAGEFVEAWKKAHPGDAVVYRDVGRKHPALLTDAWIAAAYGPNPDGPEHRATLAESNALIDELLAADRVVLSTPMHNFNVPAALKAWIDNVIRPGKTFKFTPEGLKGLVEGKKVLVVTSRGGIYSPGSPWAVFDHQEPFLRDVLGFMGVKDVTFVHAQGTNLGDEAKAKGVSEARKRLTELVTTW
jgi:FMN-dependent NADH-azoreductase